MSSGEKMPGQNPENYKQLTDFWFQSHGSNAILMIYPDSSLNHLLYHDPDKSSDEWVMLFLDGRILDGLSSDIPAVYYPNNDPIVSDEIGRQLVTEIQDLEPNLGTSTDDYSEGFFDFDIDTRSCDNFTDEYYYECYERNRHPNCSDTPLTLDSSINPDIYHLSAIKDASPDEINQDNENDNNLIFKIRDENGVVIDEASSHNSEIVIDLNNKDESYLSVKQSIDDDKEEIVYHNYKMPIEYLEWLIKNKNIPYITIDNND